MSIPSTSLAARLRVVLVGTQHPGNIGSAARALKTMGLHRLVLVAPERAPNHESAALAAGAEDVLEGAVTCASLAEAVADCQLVLGSTARGRRIALQELWPRPAAERAIASAAEGEVALVFGRERTGLTNEELDLCHAAVFIPANPAYSSLNLAAAVQVVCYELRLAMLAHEGAAAAVAEREPPAPHAQMEALFAHLDQTLAAIDFHKGRAPEVAMRKLRRLLLRAAPEEREVRLLRAILADVDRVARMAGDLPQTPDPG
ncbi:MAG TPA: RNA methyltransferase [Lysobacter sp.]|nr:RNA methyltransferase [Lysobacter sp.]